MSREIPTPVQRAVSKIDAVAFDMKLSPSGIALKLLQQKSLNPTDKRAALIVRTQELVKQNPHRGSRRSGA